MSISTPCPSDLRLTTFLEGQCSDVELDVIATHLDECVSCVSRCGQLTPQRSLLAVLEDGGQAAGQDAPISVPKSSGFATTISKELGTVKPSGQSSTPGLPATPPDVPGYETLNYVARGGMGIVWKARDQRLGRFVALKCPRSEGWSDKDDRERFLREAKAAAKLRHPHICSIYEVREVDGRPCIVMGFVDGETLREWAATKKPDSRHLALVMAKIARAVHYAHEQGIVHRDLKPANVMIETANGEPVLMDFGLAKEYAETGGLTFSGQLLGTPLYMSPEQAAGRPQEIGPASDVYALGIVLHELVCGRPPFTGTLGEVLAAIQSVGPPSLRVVCPQVHRDLETICEKAAERLPSDRYGSALAFAEDLERFARGEVILARPSGRVQRAARWLVRHRLSAAAVALLGVSILVIGAYSPQLAHQIQVSQLQQQLEYSLDKSSWTAEDLSAAEISVAELGSSRGVDANVLTERVNQKWEQSILSRLQRASLSPEQRSQLTADIGLMRSRDAVRAAQLEDHLQDRMRDWMRLVDTTSGMHWKAIFDTPRLTPRGNLIPSKEKLAALPASIHWGPGDCEGNMEIKTTARLAAGAQVNFLLFAENIFTGATEVAEFHPVGDVLAVGATGGEILLWPTTSQERPISLSAGLSRIRSLRFAGNGRYLAAADAEGTIVVWSWPELKELTRQHMAVPFANAASQDGGPVLAFADQDRLLLAGGGAESDQGVIARWRTGDWAPMPSLPVNSGPVVRLVCAQGEQVIAATQRGSIESWNAAKGNLDWKQSLFRAAPESMDARGATIAVSGSDGLIRLLAAESGQQIGLLNAHEAGVRCLRLTQRGTLVTAFVNPVVAEWNVPQGTLVRRMTLRESQTSALAVHPTRAQVAIGAKSGRTTYRDLESGGTLRLFEPSVYRFEVANLQNKCEMRIFRNSELLRIVRFDRLVEDNLEIRASRVGHRLTMVIAGSPPVEFEDIVATNAGRAGRWGVGLRGDVELCDLVVKQQLLPARLTPWEQADRAFAAGRLADAALEYERLLALSNDGVTAVTDEDLALARLRLTLCELGEGNSAPALQRLEQMTIESQGPASFLAGLTWWREYAAREDWEKTREIGRLCLSRFPTSEFSPYFPESLRRELRRAISQMSARRRGLLLPGALVRKQESLEFFEYLDANAPGSDSFEDLRMTIARLGLDAERRRECAELIWPSLDFTRLAAGCRRWEDVPTEDLKRTLIVAGDAGRTKEISELLQNTIARLPTPQGTMAIAKNARAQLALGWLASEQGQHIEAEQWASGALLRLADIASESDLEILIRATLLLGFAREARHDNAGAQSAWREGRAKVISTMKAPYLREAWQQANVMPPLLVLMALADESSDTEFSANLEIIKRQILAAAGGVVRFPESLFPDEVLVDGWRTTYGRVFARQLAEGKLLMEEELISLGRVAAWRLLQRGAMELPTEDQRKLLDDFVDRAVAWYLSTESVLPSLASSAMAWKAGWSFPPTLAVSTLPIELRPQAAYLLGCRERHARQAENSAKAFFKVARDLAQEDSLTRRLATEAIQSTGD
jgi:serine/threonine protein kinase